ncbi:hypothetical protein BJF93_03590 [Xaviernesmea oryzae]|uniref:Glycosyltransferase 2-like domain-containing protein n=1 Tax=Xaviernesmea oryzae TaxID=464029 RepID=A0A1Q9AUE3_9HYPH|nr:hypothetical protein BJF93_03590 [Xaviernesmea oryzae]
MGRLNIDRPIRVIVADNDSEQQQGKAACEAIIAAGFAHPLEIVVVEQRGIAPTRNALVRQALKDPAIQWIAMLDDDEWAEPDWLAQLLRVRQQYDADVVGGPVFRVFEVPVPDYIAEANQPVFENMKTGPLDLVDATNNVLFRADLFREMPEPWFDPQYALMGCEDKDLFLGLRLKGKRFAWASEAVIREEMPASRSTVKWMLQRAYRIGNTDTIVNLKHRPPEFTVVSEATKMSGAMALALFNMTVMGWSAANRFKGARLAARVFGKVVALTGRRHEEYRVIHGS